jgi:hypothetical protein
MQSYVRSIVAFDISLVLRILNLFISGLVATVAPTGVGCVQGILSVLWLHSLRIISSDNVTSFLTAA